MANNATNLVSYETICQLCITLKGLQFLHHTKRMQMLCHIKRSRTSVSYYKGCQFSVSQIEYLLGGSSKKGSHIYFLLIVAMVLLFWYQIVLLWHQVTNGSIRTTFISNNNTTQKTCNRKYTWLSFCYCPLVGILFEELTILCCTKWLPIIY